MGCEESELCFRLGEFIFIQMVREGKITGEQFEELRDQLIVCQRLTIFSTACLFVQLGQLCLLLW